MTVTFHQRHADNRAGRACRRYGTEYQSLEDIDQLAESIEPDASGPCPDLPGSVTKIAYLLKRYELGFPMHRADDFREAEDEVYAQDRFVRRTTHHATT